KEDRAARGVWHLLGSTPFGARQCSVAFERIVWPFGSNSAARQYRRPAQRHLLHRGRPFQSRSPQTEVGRMVTDRLAGAPAAALDNAIYIKRPTNPGKRNGTEIRRRSASPAHRLRLRLAPDARNPSLPAQIRTPIRIPEGAIIA